MKKLSTIIMALALVLGMSQCKKQETPTTGNTTPIYPGVHITVNVGENEDNGGKGENGEKHHIAPYYGLFSFSDGDKLYVGHNGQYVGTLTFANGFFSGDIFPNPNVTDKPLHFYFVGNAVVTGTPSANQTTSLSINIADQSQNLPVLSYGASNELYTGPNNTYSTTLRNQCALVRINLLTETTDAITLSNVPNAATIDFINNAITPTNTTGDITLYGEEGVETHRWAILLPETDLSDRDDLIWQGEGGEQGMPSIGNNTYVNAGIGEGIQIQNLPAVTLPNEDLVIKNSSNVFSEFTVSSTGKKVYFSKANLTWNSTAGYHFHDTQFDEEHSGGTNLIYPYPASGDVTLSNLTGLDRFTWGHIPNQGINTSYYITNQQLSAGLDPEWGKQMTGEGNDQWRTLTADEWNYLLHKRSGNRFMLVSVLVPITYNNEPYYTNVQGLLLFPDGFNYSGLGLTQATGVTTGIGFWPGRINKVYGNDDYQPASGNYTVTYDSYMDAYTTNFVAGPYKLIEPKNNLEHLYTNPSSNMYKLLQAGCVFLPAVGCREGAEYKKYHYYDNRRHAAQGFYWAADRVISGTSENAKYFWFGYVGGSNVETDPRPTFEANNTQHRSLGCCVRLVWDAN
jgi:hypothetical protein